MPRIQLKSNSPEYADPGEKQPKSRRCDMPGCKTAGEHKAPKARDLSDYYWFCMDHVREYNAAWNFFSGMSDKEVEDYVVRSMHGDRPTWRYDLDGAREDILRRATWKTYRFTEQEPPKDFRARQADGLTRNTPEFQALALLGLEPPVDLRVIKARYRDLAKKHHPDANNGSPQSEELLKSINMAYTILKLAYEKYDALRET